MCRISENHQVTLAVVLVGGCPALGPVAAHGREAAVGDQAPQHDVSADVGALLKGRRRFSVRVLVHTMQIGIQHFCMLFVIRG